MCIRQSDAQYGAVQGLFWPFPRALGDAADNASPAAIPIKIRSRLIDDYGIDSDFVKVRVRGMFPSMSVKQFISIADVDAAFGRSLRRNSLCCTQNLPVIRL